MTQSALNTFNIEHLCENLNMAVIWLNEQRRITYLNSTAVELFQISLKRVVGLPCKSILPDLEEGLNECGNRRLTIHDKKITLPDNQKIRVSKTITYIQGNKKNDSGWLIEIVNTERHHRIVEEDERWHQYEASNMLARTLAHEVKNPLAGIYGATQLLEMRLIEEPKAKKYIEVILGEVTRLKNLVNRMLGPRAEMNLEPYNLHELIRYVLNIVQPEKPDNIKIRLDYDPSIPEINIDFESMVQAVLNIIQNAIQAMSQHGGFLTLKTRVQYKFTMGSKTYPLVAVLSIIDEGEGIPEAYFDSIFYPMVTTKKEGTGLGLPVSQNIVRQHGGLIVADSEPGHTVFHIYLPFEHHQQLSEMEQTL